MFNIYMQDQPVKIYWENWEHICCMQLKYAYCMCEKKNFNVQTKIICIFKKVPKRHYISIQTVYL